jgi:HK97 gp10 family phage protein
MTADTDTIKGLDAVFGQFDQLPPKLAQNVLRGALRAGGKVQLAEARRLAPRETTGPHPGALADSLRLSTSVRSGTVRAQVKAGGRLAFWAKFVEFGTAAHLIVASIKKSLFFGGHNEDSVQHPGAKKKPFMRPALDGTFRAALDAVAAYIRKRLTKEGIETPDPGD